MLSRTFSLRAADRPVRLCFQISILLDRWIGIIFKQITKLGRDSKRFLTWIRNVVYLPSAIMPFKLNEITCGSRPCLLAMIAGIVSEFERLSSWKQGRQSNCRARWTNRDGRALKTMGERSEPKNWGSLECFFLCVTMTPFTYRFNFWSVLEVVPDRKCLRCSGAETVPDRRSKKCYG